MPIDLTEFAEDINGAFDAGNPVAFGYIGLDDAPHVSYRGSIQVLEAGDRMALWARNPDGGLVAALPTRPLVSLAFMSLPSVLLMFRGRARLAPELNDVVYAAMPQGERDRDPDRKGIAVAIDVELAEGRRRGAPRNERFRIAA